MRWRIYFKGKCIKHGDTHKPYFLRLFRFGKGRVENKLMDEHIIVDGKVEKLDGDLIHYDYKGLDAWLNKHIWYSNLELQMYNTQYDMIGGNIAQQQKRDLCHRLPIITCNHTNIEKVIPMVFSVVNVKAIMQNCF